MPVQASPVDSPKHEVTLLVSDCKIDHKKRLGVLSWDEV